MSSSEIEIVFCGDFVAHNPEQIVVSSEIKNIINNGDLRVINFEAPIESDACPLDKSGPILCQSPESAKFVEDLGFDVVSMCNNHIFDYGIEGYQTTKKAFQKAQTIGVGRWEEAYKVSVYKVKSKKIGVLAFGQREFMVLDDISNPAQQYGCAWINHALVVEKIREAKNNGVDYLFVYPHCGVEDISTPLPEWRNRYKELIDAGADAVVASHPHIIQGYENYKNKFIFYSLGNFFFEKKSKHQHWSKGVILTLKIIDDKISFEINYVKRENLNLVLDSENPSLIDDLNLVLSDNNKYFEVLNSQINALAPMYLNYYERSLNGISKGLSFKNIVRRIRNAFKGQREYLLLLNMIRCESHRWMFLRWINNTIKNDCK